MLRRKQPRCRSRGERFSAGGAVTSVLGREQPRAPAGWEGPCGWSQMRGQLVDTPGEVGKCPELTGLRMTQGRASRFTPGTAEGPGWLWGGKWRRPDTHCLVRRGDHGRSLGFTAAWAPVSLEEAGRTWRAHTEQRGREGRSVVSDSLQSPGLYSPWDSPGQNPGVRGLSLLQGISPTQGWNPGLPHCRQILRQLSKQGSPRRLEWVAYPFCRGSSQPRTWTGVSCTAGGLFTDWAMREAPRGCEKALQLIPSSHQHLSSRPRWAGLARHILP